MRAEQHSPEPACSALTCFGGERERENDCASVLGAKGKTNLTCLGFQAEPASLHSSQKLWSAEHGTGGLTVRQRAGACNQRLISHLTSLSPEKTGQAQVSASAGLIHHQGFWPPRRHLFQTWRTLCNENPSSLPCKPCALGLISSN